MNAVTLTARTLTIPMRWLVLAVSMLVLATAPPAGAATRADALLAETVIDFSSAGQGPLAPDFFAAQGLLVTTEHLQPFVGFIQGDEALIGGGSYGDVQGRLLHPVASIATRVALAYQMTVEFTLRAFGADGRLVGVMSKSVTQDLGDPENTPFGYVELRLDALTLPAASFTISSRFVRSSARQNRVAAFGASTIMFTPLTTPPTKQACKRGGWRHYVNERGLLLRNQGECVSLVVSHRHGLR